MSVQPNILLILADDMGYGDFGVFGDGSAKTPTLDRLVDEGICLTQHYSASAVCAPARAALLTGRYPHRTGAIDTLEGRGLDRLALRETTLADLLSGAGYATGLIGKWHLGALDPRFHPKARGFDEFVGFRGGWQDYYDWRLHYNHQIKPSDGRYLTDVFTEEAVGFIRRHQAEPFFLHLTYNAPHFPLQAPDELVQPYLENDNLTNGAAYIYAMNERMDWGIARILAELEQQGLAENTIVIFTSDNGPQLNVRGEWDTRRYNAHFNGSKGNVYEGGIRVPLIIRWPAGLEGGRPLHEMVHFTDWLPTLLAAVGLTPPPELNLDGHNILPLLRGEGGQVNPRRFWQWNRYTPDVTSNAAMRDGDWKLVRPVIAETMVLSEADLAMDSALKYQPDQFTDIVREPEPNRTVPPPPPPQLYHIGSDPYEQTDLAESQPTRTASMLRELETWFEQVEAERRTIPPT